MWKEDGYLMSGSDWAFLTAFALACGMYVGATFPWVIQWVRNKISKKNSEED